MSCPRRRRVVSTLCAAALLSSGAAASADARPRTDSVWAVDVTGRAANGFHVTWSDGHASFVPSRRARLDECPDDQQRDQCVAAVHVSTRHWTLLRDSLDHAEEARAAYLDMLSKRVEYATRVLLAWLREITRTLHLKGL